MSSALPSATRSPRQLAWWIVLASLGLYGYSMARPYLLQDDFQILAQSGTWERTWAGLWVPQNEHAMPLGRLLAFGLRRVSPIIALPWAAGLVGPLALVAGLPLVYLFVKRELGHPFYSVVAMALFGVSAVYQQAIYWFASSFSVLALDTLLLALLAAQRWRQVGGIAYLFLAGLACCLAPCWFASGILAGPLCCVYLWAGSWRGLDTWPRMLRRVAPGIVMLAGTGLFLAVSLPRTAERILHLEHYQGKTAIQAFDPQNGLIFTCRSIVDNLLLGIVGINTVEVPVILVGAILALLALAAAWWWWQAPDGRLVLLGAALIWSSYLLTYSARAAWGYEGLMTTSTWSRYHLLPQLGLALAVVGGLPGRRGLWPAGDKTSFDITAKLSAPDGEGRSQAVTPEPRKGAVMLGPTEHRGEPMRKGWFYLAPGDALTRRQARVLGWLIVVLLVAQLPRAVGASVICPPFLAGILNRPEDSQSMTAQQQGLAVIAEVDRRCRERHISADAALRSLPPLEISGWSFVPNGWELLQGSDDLRPATDDDVKALLRGFVDGENGFNLRK